jgi:3-oxoacyl-[acyl-carrier protein] reductase
MAKQLGKENIRVNTVAPGNIMFPGGNWERIVAGNPDYFGKWIDREVALQRFGTVQEIADAVVFASSERASFLTGEVMIVDGGQVR